MSGSLERLTQMNGCEIAASRYVALPQIRSEKVDTDNRVARTLIQIAVKLNRYRIVLTISAWPLRIEGTLRISVGSVQYK